MPQTFPRFAGGTIPRSGSVPCGGAVASDRGGTACETRREERLRRPASGRDVRDRVAVWPTSTGPVFPATDRRRERRRASECEHPAFDSMCAK